MEGALFGVSSGSKNGIKQTVERPPKDYRRVKRLRVENECFVLSIIAVAFFCWLSICCNRFKEGTQNPPRRTDEPSPPRDRRRIIERLLYFGSGKYMVAAIRIGDFSRKI